jgi:myo-inositol-1-phosphate synthase
VRKNGVWLVGACGNVGMMTIVGARAIARGLAGRTGLVTELAELRALPLAPIEGLVFGGHEVGGRSLREAARDFARRAGVLTDRMLEAVGPDLDAVQEDLRPGFPQRPVRAFDGTTKGTAGPRAAVEGIRAELDAFRARHALDDVVVVTVATTEARPEERPEWASLTRLRAALDDDRAEVFPPSMLYAYAALDGGYPYVNFTPSTGASVPALDELARARRTVHAGRDGKTGETLVKTTLAPHFALRNHKVHAWEGYNMLGNPDGEALRDPRTRDAKCTSKDRSLRSILGEHAGHSSVHIDFVPSLDDWKVAFDFIHFEGFLGARMTMQFTWQGCDSALAHTACFFKDPCGADVHAFTEQFELLRDYVRGQRQRHAKPAG